MHAAHGSGYPHGMESRAKVLRHPAHPMLVVFPLGLVTHRPGLPVASGYVIAAGIVGGLVAAIAGLALPAGTRAKRVGTVHGLGNLVVVGLSAVDAPSSLSRHGIRTPDPVGP